MKKLLFVVGLINCLALAAKAQDKPLAPSQYRSHLYKVATLCDVVSSVKILSDTVTYLYMGGKVPNETFTIAVKGTKVQLDWANLKNKRLCVTGTLLLYKNTIQVIASEPNQIIIDK